MTFKEYAKYIYKTEKWKSQPQRKKDCLYNITCAGKGDEFCKTNDEDCKKCKAFDVMSLGLESMAKDGFKGIEKKQGNEHTKKPE